MRMGIPIRHLAVAILAALGLASPVSAGEPHVVFQTSPIGWLWDGQYDGRVTVGLLRRHGDQALGAVDRLDGELVGVDGVYYQVRGDGTVHVLDDHVTIPFAQVTTFRPSERITVSMQPTAKALGETLDRQLRRRDGVALRVRATFPQLVLRSVPAQQPPYVPLAEVLKTQPIFKFREITGTMVGFRGPDRKDGVVVPGFHWHFVSDDRQSGGHVLELEMAAATVDVGYDDRLVIAEPAEVRDYPLLGERGAGRAMGAPVGFDD